MKYSSKKTIIEAQEIVHTSAIDDGDYAVALKNGDNIVIKKAQCGAHEPKAGDFFITRDDGDNYLCPAKVFHEKYAPELTALEKDDEAAASVAKTANRVTLKSIEDKIASMEYLHSLVAPHYTIALVHMKNGFVVTGQSAPADSKNFDLELGKRFAREDALRKVWALEGYLLREQLSHEPAGEA